MEEKTPREILEQFYKDNHLELDGGQRSSSVRIEMSKKIYFYFPNFDARRKALIKHDIHHLVTGYSASSLAGESEISAWEIASGCRKYWAAFLIDTSGFMLGIPLNFRNLLKAFARGRRTKCLYHDTLSNDEALDMKMDALRSYLLLDQHPKDCRPTLVDFLLFSLFAFWGLLVSTLSIVLIPFLVFYTIYMTFSSKKQSTLNQ